MPLQKPSGLSPEHAAQFQDSSIVRAYRHRKPYSDEAFNILSQLAGSPEPRILDLGCGTGDLTMGLARFARQIDALDISEEMLSEAKRRPLSSRQVQWILSPAETAPISGPYDLVTAAQSLHWMDWPVVFAKIKTALKPGRFLAIVERGYVNRAWWNDEFQSIIDFYSTNKDFQKYGLIEELQSRQLFRLAGTQKTSPIPFRQSVGDLIEAFHSRNGFSRERMGESAAAFDQAAAVHLAKFAKDGMLDLGATTSITWGNVCPQK